MIIPYKPTKLSEILKEIYESEREILSKYKLSQLKDIKNLDYYFLLDLESYRRKPIPPEIVKYSFKRKIMKYHPDRNGSNEIYLALKMACDVLSDNFLKLKYDQYFMNPINVEDREYSTDEFFKIFNEKFKELERFSEKKVVEISDDLNKFYGFWRNFESNRNFEFLDLVENKEVDFKNIKKMKNEHFREIRNLVEICNKRDPRIVRVKSKFVDEKWNDEDISNLKRVAKSCMKNNKVNCLLVAKKLNRNLNEVIQKINQMRL